MSNTASPQVFEDVACTACGCVCDDLSVTIAGDRIESFGPQCDLAQRWFDAIRTAPERPAAMAHGRAVPFDHAIAEAAGLLKRSRAPLVYGLSHSSTPGQRAAVELAERIGAIIDTTASVCHGPSIVAIQNAGESTCSLGEVRQRADLVLFWGGDPAVTHPRHFERYSIEPASEFLPNGRGDRHVVVIDSAATATSRIADDFLKVAPERDFELIAALRMLIRNPEAQLSVDCGVPLDAIARLAERMRSCRYGIVFFGLGLAQSPQGHLTVESLLRLVAELNAVTRFTARRLRIPGDVSGADSVLCWQTGFPFGVDLSRGYPRYNPGEFTANELLERGDVDSAIIIGSESLPAFSDLARRTLADLPTIVLDPGHVTPDFTPGIQFTTAVYGVHAPGTVYRMDEIPIPVRSLYPTQYPTDEAVLKAIAKRFG